MSSARISAVSKEKIQHRLDRPERSGGGRLRLLLSLRRVAAIHHLGAKCAQNRRNSFLVDFSTRQRRAHDRLADPASCSGAANCVASNLGQFSARHHFVRASLRSNDPDYGPVTIKHRTSQARQSDARLSHEFQTRRGRGNNTVSAGTPRTQGAS
jgi:hypothetical protein